MKNLFKRWRSLQEGQKAAEKTAINLAVNEAVAKKEFPNETWIRSDSINRQLY